MDIGSIFQKSLIDVFLNPLNIKIFIVGILFVVFIIILRGLIDRAFKSYKPTKAKTSTLIIVEIFIIIVGIAAWVCLGR